MTAPIWMASPPEVWSALLGSGPGPGSLLAAGAAWQELAAEYASAAEQLSALLAAVQAGTWQGPSAEAYVAAHVPYLAWLLQNSGTSTAAALEADTVAAAYTAALSVMPTLEELGANRATLATLMATNFFGVNTIPIELTEMDYLRMWLQAATTMAMYEAVSETALTWTPPTAPPPPIQKANTASHDAGPGPDSLSWWVTRVEEVSQAIQGDTAQFPSNPSGAITQLLSDPVLITEVPHWAGEALTTFIPQVSQLTQLSFGLVVPFLPIVSAGGLAGLAGLGNLSQSVASMPAPGVVAAPAPSTPGPVAGMASTPAAPTAAPATAPAPTTAPAASTVASTAPPSIPPAGAEGFAYPYVVGPPGAGLGGGMRTSAVAQRKAPEPDIAAAAAVAATREEVRRQRARRAGLIDRGYRHEYPDLDADADPDASVAASDQGAGTLGFAGTADKAGAGQAAGLTTLAGDSLGSGPTMPMMPSSWDLDTDEPDTP